MKLLWGLGGDKTFETGIDKGVLYVNDAGIAWNGLISVAEAPSGGDVTPFYIDGIKYLNVLASEEYEATIEAYTYPDEFLPCDGVSQIGRGLFATQQSRKPFDLSYRTQIGNDLSQNQGYKIHLVYGATAAPTGRANASMNETISPENFSWKIVTKPPVFRGYKPTSHFIIDSTETPSELMSQIEDILYGNDSVDARLPAIPELMFIFENYDSSIYDDGLLTDVTVFIVVDGGFIDDVDDTILDGGIL